MRNYRNYNRYDRESKVFAAVMIIIVAAMIALGVLTLMGMFDEPMWKPDKVYPLANANISWMQSFYGGVF